jgi:hypothetical protein
MYTRSGVNFEINPYTPLSSNETNTRYQVNVYPQSLDAPNTASTQKPQTLTFRERKCEKKATRKAIHKSSEGTNKRPLNKSKKY